MKLKAVAILFIIILIVHGFIHLIGFVRELRLAEIPKFSGKTKNGLSIGILESVTNPVRAEIANGENRREELIEPLSNYFMSRVLQDFNKGNTILGGVFTYVKREPGVADLNQNAFSGGLDFQHAWKNKWWKNSILPIGIIHKANMVIITNQIRYPFWPFG